MIRYKRKTDFSLAVSAYRIENDYKFQWNKNDILMIKKTVSEMILKDDNKVRISKTTRVYCQLVICQ